MSEDKSIHSLSLSQTLDLLSPEAVERVHDQTLHILDQVGIQIDSKQVRKRLGDVGARVDDGTKRVQFPSQLVEDTLALAPRSFVMSARAPGADLVVDGTQGYLTSDGCAANVIDLETGVRRPSTKHDLGQISKLADALPEIGFLWQSVAARDVPAHVESMHELHVQFANTGKHIQMMTAVTAQAAQGVVDIARIVAGGADQLRKHPVLSAFQCRVSPLRYEEGALEAAVVYGEAGVPCGFVVMPITCASSPATPGGTLVQANAEILAGIVTLESLVPGTPTFYGCCATVMDHFSGAAACGGPEDLFYQMASAQLAHFYGVPASIGTFATGAKTANWQAGLENGISGLASALSGAEMFCGAGLLHGASVFSFEQMLLDAETFRLLSHLFTVPSQVPEDSFLPVLEKVGPGGHFLEERHTLQHMRNLWLPRFFDRRSWEEWEAEGKPGPRQEAHGRVGSILDSHQPPMLDDKMDAEIGKIIQSYEGDN